MARELSGVGYRLLCPVRDPDTPAARRLQQLADDGAALELKSLDLSDRESTRRGLDALRADAVISCLASRAGGILDSERVDYAANRSLLDWAGAQGVGQFTLLSAICVQKPRLAFQFAKARFEQELAASGIPHSIVRPTAFFKSLSGQLSRVRAGKAFLMFGDGELTACKPIAEADLARFLRRAMEDPALAGVQPIGGPGPALTPRTQAEMLFKLLDRPPRTRSVSPSILSGIARLLDPPGRLLPPLAERAEFARIGHYYATESMLLWDAEAERYDADATPEFGERTLLDSYRAQIDGSESQALGEHAMFD